MATTTTTAERNQQALDEAYEDAHAFVIHYLDEIRARIHDLPAPESEGLNWAHVGSMNKIKNDLREVVDFLNNYGE